MAKLAIYGTGAVGGYFGARLAESGHAVTFVSRGQDLRAMREGGLHVESIHGDITLSVVRAVESLPPADYDAVLLAVKVHDLPATLDDVATNAGPRALIVSLQNGVDAEPLLETRFAGRVVGAVAIVNAEVVAPGRIRHTLLGRITVGAWGDTSRARVDELSGWLVGAGIDGSVSDDVRRDLWSKLCWNAAFNASTALAGTSPGDLLEDTEGEHLIRGIMAEVVAVAAAEGVALPESVVDRFLVMSRRMKDDVRTSMLVDRERGRAMEVDAISGAVVSRGRAANVATPLNQALYALLRANQRAGQTTS